MGAVQFFGEIAPPPAPIGAKIRILKNLNNRKED
jgi:hypothetical protein